MRHDRIIDLFGGNSVLAKLVGRSDSAISRWRDNGIPPNMWLQITALSGKNADEVVTIEDLATGPPSASGSYRTKSPRTKARAPKASSQRPGGRPKG